jgi:hypothetical protein
LKIDRRVLRRSQIPVPLKRPRPFDASCNCLKLNVGVKLMTCSHVFVTRLPAGHGLRQNTMRLAIPIARRSCPNWLK